MKNLPDYIAEFKYSVLLCLMIQNRWLNQIHLSTLSALYNKS